MPGYLSFLWFIILWVWLMVRQEIDRGLRRLFCTAWGSLGLELLSISTASPEWIAEWFAGQTGKAGLGGMVVGWGLVSNRPGRLVVPVLLFVFAAVVVTIVLQSVGFAPAVEMR